MSASKTFALVKPIWNKLYTLSDVLKFIESRGFVIKEMRLRRLLPEDVDIFYEEHVGKSFYEAMRTYMCSGPVVGMLLSARPRPSGKDAIACWRSSLGATDSAKAAPGTLREGYGNKTGIMFQNVAHGSDSPEAAIREAGLWGWTLDAADKEKSSTTPP